VVLSLVPVVNGEMIGPGRLLWQYLAPVLLLVAFARWEVRTGRRGRQRLLDPRLARHLRLRRPDRAWSTWSQVPVRIAGAVCGALQTAQLDRFGAWERSPGDDLLPGAHRYLARLFGDCLQACWLPPASCRWLFMAIAELMRRRHHRLDQSAT
jgi:hypothetical protein